MFPDVEARRLHSCDRGARRRAAIVALLLSLGLSCLGIQRALQLETRDDFFQVVMARDDSLRVQPQTNVPDKQMERSDFLQLQGPSRAPLEAAAKLEVQIVQEHRDWQDARSSSLSDSKEVAEDGESVAAGVEKIVAPKVCLAVIAATTSNIELQIRLVHLSNQHRQSNFTQRYLVLNGRLVDDSMINVARFLQQERYIDEWVISNYSSEYLLSVNSTANFGGSFEVPRSSNGDISRRSLDADAPGIELEHYFAIDWCNADYIAVVNSDAVMFSKPGYSWIEQGIKALHLNTDIALIIPPFPGMSKRRVRKRITTEPMPKPNHGHFAQGVALIDTTCEYPFSLPVTAALLDIHRYKQLAPRSQIMEHRCAGALVHGKPCQTLPYVRKCGGIRTWAASLECVICNSPELRQVHLAEERLCWLWHAPISSLRYDMGALREEIRKAEA